MTQGMWRVHWKSLRGAGEGFGKPLSERAAKDVAEFMDKKYPKVKYWAAPVHPEPEGKQ